MLALPTWTSASLPLAGEPALAHTPCRQLAGPPAPPHRVATFATAFPYSGSLSLAQGHIWELRASASQAPTGPHGCAAQAISGGQRGPRTAALPSVGHLVLQGADEEPNTPLNSCVSV